MIDCHLEKELDQTLSFVCLQLEESSHNKKPVLYHSFKVAVLLYTYGYNREIVLAGALHDLLEDTDVHEEVLKDKFGNKIAEIVKAVSFDKKIINPKEQAKNLFLNCVQCGKEALLVKCADLFDNIHYVQFVKDKTKREQLFFKYQLFLDMAKNQIGNEKIYLDLFKEYQKEIKR